MLTPTVTRTLRPWPLHLLPSTSSPQHRPNHDDLVSWSSAGRQKPSNNNLQNTRTATAPPVMTWWDDCDWSHNKSWWATWGGNLTKNQWKPRVVMIRTLSSLRTPQVVVMTTCSTSSNDRVRIMATLGFQCSFRITGALCGKPVGHGDSSHRRQCGVLILSLLGNTWCFPLVWCYSNETCW